MSPECAEVHVVHVNFAWVEKSIELTSRRKRFDWTIFSAVRLRVEVNLPMRVN